MKIEQVICVFESGDYITLGCSRFSDDQLPDTIEEAALPAFGKVVMTNYLEQALNCPYLPVFQQLNPL